MTTSIYIYSHSNYPPSNIVSVCDLTIPPLHSASYYQLSHDGGLPEKQKSSGLLIYTGTGSTSWAFNVNKFTACEVTRILRAAERDGVALGLPPGNTLKALSTKSET